MLKNDVKENTNTNKLISEVINIKGSLLINKKGCTLLYTLSIFGFMTFIVCSSSISLLSFIKISFVKFLVDSLFTSLLKLINFLLLVLFLFLFLLIFLFLDFSK